MLEEFTLGSEVRRVVKPRNKGIIMILDTLSHPIECLGLEERAPYIDYAKIGWGLPLLLKEDELKKRITHYLAHNVDVGFGGTMMELASIKGKARELLDKSWEIGFNIAEISSGIIDIPLKDRLELAEYARDLGFKVTFEVGKKDPSMRLPMRDIIRDIRAALNSGVVWKVIIEGREFGRSSIIFDENGNLRVHSFSSLISIFNHENLIFEAPLIKQHVELIKRLGSNVNLGNIKIGDVLSLESLRLGVRGDTFLISPRKGLADGSPSEKFVIYILRQFGPMSASEIKEKTGLPYRTIYKALKDLRDKELAKHLSLKGKSSIWAPSPPQKSEYI